jgi:hypothetical protein
MTATSPLFDIVLAPGGNPALPRVRSLSEIDFVVRKMNELQIGPYPQVTDSSFWNFSFRQALRLTEKLA